MTPVLKELPYSIEKSEGMAPFWDGLNNGELKTTQCSKCDIIHYPPSPILCNRCFGQEMNWINIPLEGEVTTFTHVSAPPQGFQGNYLLVSVKMDKLGKPILGRFIGDKVNIGDRVKVEFERVGDQSLFVFANKS